MANLLIIDADRTATVELRKALRAAGHSTAVETSGWDALERLLGATPDLVLLELELPDLDGLELLEQLRGQGSTVPVIVCSKRTAPPERAAALEHGADDYIAKPCYLPELLARIQLRLRTLAPTTPTGSATICHGDLELDRLHRVARVNGKEVKLSGREFELALEFVRNAGKALTREQLLNSVWGLNFVTDSNVVDVYVRYLRDKLGKQRFETLRGVGYRMP